MALTCPQCASPMNEVKAEAITGYLIVLDQCPRCGGIWCDRWELYPVTAAAAERLDRVDQAALWQPTAEADVQLACPRCRARMFRFRDPTIPPDARIERCPNCDGMWLNRGELRRFKERGAQLPGPTQATEDRSVSDPQLDHLAQQALRDPQSWPTVRRLDEVEAPQADADAADIGSELKSSVVWLIARAALRLLLHV